MIDQDGKNQGVLSLAKALELSVAAGLDLIEISPTANPPVARIMDFGKFQYEKAKEEKQARKKVKEVEIRGIRARLNTSPHDLELKAKKAEEFLARGDRIRFDLILRGREKGIKKEFIDQRLERMLSVITIPYDIVEAPKKGPRGLTLTLAPRKHGQNKQVSNKAVQSDEVGKATPAKTESGSL